MPSNGTAHRALDRWSEGFVQLTEAKPSPPIFRRWAALTTIAAVLERKCWIVSSYGQLFTNIYTILVGPPASGKTVALDAARSILEMVEGIRIAPSSVTSASLIDDLRRAERTFIHEGQTHTYHSLAVFSREMSLLLPDYEIRQMSNLIDFFDCNNNFEESRRGREQQVLKIPNVQINMLACTTPAFLGNFLPESAWHEGFASRILLVYQGVKQWKDPWSQDAEYNHDLANAVVSDLQQVALLQGQFKWELRAQEAFREWSRQGGPPIPEHPKLTYYNERRSALMMKLCGLLCADRTNDMIITLEDYQLALDYLLDAESYMGDIFKVMSGGATASALENSWSFLWSMYAKNGQKPISDMIIYKFIAERTNTPSHGVRHMVELMVKSGLIEDMGAIPGSTRRMYRPLQRAQH